MKNFLAPALIIFSVISGFSQDKLPFIDIDDIQQKVNSATERGDFSKAISYLDMVSKNDSSYCSALTSKAYYLLQEKKYDETIRVCNEGIELGCEESKVYFYINKGVALLNKEDYESANKTLDKGLKLYPKNYLLTYNKGVSLESSEKYAEAAQAYKQAIILNPMYKKSHRQLGNLCYKQELMAQALMCYNMYLFLDPDSDDSFDILKSLNGIAAATNENKADPGVQLSSEDAGFEDMDIVLNQKIALSASYETGIDVDLALVRQNHALFQQLKDFKGNDGFWSKKYVPFFQWINNNDYFDEFIYTLIYTSDDNEHSRLVKRNEKELIEFVPKAFVKWQEILAKNDKVIDGKKVSYYNFYSDSHVQAQGPMADGEAYGQWDLFNEDGQLVAVGNFNKKGEKDGNWKWYYPSGTLKETALYKNDKLQGNNKLYHENGRLNIDANFLDDELDGRYRLYNKYGAMLQDKYYKAGVLDGMFTSFFSTGETMVEFKIPYTQDEVHGNLIEYYSNGKIFAQANHENGKKQGKEQKFFINDILYSEIEYQNGEPNGSYKSFYIDNTPREVGQTLNGYYNGPWKSYHRNGTLETEFVYDNGEVDGLYKKYDTDGKLYYEYQYRKGEIIAYTFYNKQGEIIKEARKRGGEFLYTGFSPLGIQISEGIYDISGGKMGKWKFYTENGTLSSEGDYKENKLNGTYIEYYNNGNKKQIAQYADDQLQGYFQSFYIDGTLYAQGYYKDGLEVGEWRTYYNDGTLKDISYYHEGKLNGEYQLFTVDGKPAIIYNYEFGSVLSGKFLDKEAKVLQVINYEKEEDDYQIVYKHFNNAPASIYTYKHGVKHGAYTNTNFYGTTTVTGSFLNGAEDGEWIWYFDNGQKKRVRNYLNGEYHGKALDYYENGQLENEYLYEHGEATGTWVSYHENGTIYTRSDYRFNEYHGRKEFYSPNGHLQLVRIYDHGRLTGYTYLGKDGKELPVIPVENETTVIKAFFDNGKVSREMEYKNGQLVNKYKAYYYNGQLENELDYVVNTYHGKDIEYYENGKLKVERSYNYDDLHGPLKEYYENGVIKLEAEYRNGERVGTGSYYDENGKLTKKEYYFNGGIYEVETF